ncbi:MAG: helix-turn-helix domain-containing protein [Thermoleophilia bacterium]
MATSTTSTVQPDALISAREAARRLGVSVTSVHRLRVAGRLPGIRLHPTAPLRFEPEAVAALIAHGREAA